MQRELFLFFFISVLKPISVKFHKKTNGALHHTSEYEIPNLIVRRGQQFNISVGFNGTFDESKHKFVLQFETGK